MHFINRSIWNSSQDNEVVLNIIATVLAPSMHVVFTSGTYQCLCFIKSNSISGTSVWRGVATVPWPSPQTLKIKNVYTVFGSVYCQYSAVYTKMFNFRQITLFCLEKHFSKHKMTIFSTNLGGGMASLTLPWLRICFALPRKFSAYATDYNCLLFIIIPPVTDVHVMLKKIECERRIWSTKRGQGKTERHLYLSIK